MNDYYKSEEHANAQLHVGRRIGIEVARRQFSKAHAEANQIIQHNNQVISLQQQRIVQLEAELASVAVKVVVNSINMFSALFGGQIYFCRNFMINVWLLGAVAL